MGGGGYTHHRSVRRWQEGCSKRRCEVDAEVSVMWLLGWEPLARACRRPADDGKGRKELPPWSPPQGRQTCKLLRLEFRDRFWTFDLLQNCNEFVLFIDAMFVVICYSGHRKLTVPQKGIGVSLQREERMRSG